VEAHLAHVKAVTGVDLPKYYNPTAINPLKFAEQIKKRQVRVLLLFLLHWTATGAATV
jgi:hypothetical protein